MGTVVPPPPFIIDPAKNYNVTVNRWLTFAAEACDIGFIGSDLEGIRTGAEIIAWLDAGKECTYETLLSPLGLFITERIINLEEVP